jgi:hypothetical protein
MEPQPNRAIFQMAEAKVPLLMTVKDVAEYMRLFGGRIGRRIMIATRKN